MIDIDCGGTQSPVTVMQWASRVAERNRSEAVRRLDGTPSERERAALDALVSRLVAGVVVEPICRCYAIHDHERAATLVETLFQHAGDPPSAER